MSTLPPNLYAVLGVDKTANQTQIDSTYQQRSADLKKQNTPEAKQQLAQIDRAYQALGSADKRQTYDQTGKEPAVTYKPIGTTFIT